MIQNKKDYYRFLDEEKSHISYISAIFGGVIIHNYYFVIG